MRPKSSSPPTGPEAKPPILSRPRVLLSSAGQGWTYLRADLLHLPRGLVEVPGGDSHRLGIHLGPPVNANCCCDGRRMRRVQKSGDIDIVPAGVSGSWEDDADCRLLQLRLHPTLLFQVSGELGVGESLLRPRFQLRDARIEAIAWAIKAELEDETPSDPLFLDHLAHALAVRLVAVALPSSGAALERHGQEKLPERQLRTLTDFIESHLDQKLHLVDLGNLVGLSVTRLKTLFRNRTGLPVHQYIMRRRVEYARALLTTSTMALSEVAVAAGFSHQSHMTTTMRRLLGQTPSDVSRLASTVGPNLQNST